MGTGWRSAFCTSIPRDPEVTIATTTSVAENDKQKQTNYSSSRSQSRNPSPRTSLSNKRLGFLSGGNSNSNSNPSTPRLQSSVTSQSLRCRTSSTNEIDESPRLNCKLTAPKSTSSTPKKSPSTLLGSNPSSPRSPLKFSIFKNSLRLSRSSCEICSQSVKTGQGTAIFTAECSHAFHFPCIASYVLKQGRLVCPVCSVAWKDVPLLAIPKSVSNQEEDATEIKQIDTQSETRVNVNVKSKVETQQLQTRQIVRAYDDDEPLLSPTAGVRFNSIPETNENEEDDETEEFQGFLVNPEPPKIDSVKSMTGNGDDGSMTKGGDLMKSVQVSLSPESALISVGRDHESYAVAFRVRVPSRSSYTAPIFKPGRRAPIDLVTVLDVSSGMNGAKLQMLKRAMRLLISSLGSADRLSIVAFSASPKRMLPLGRMTVHGQRSARRIIDRLVCGDQGSSAGDALRKAAKVLEDRREKNQVASIMLLSNGQDEQAQIRTMSVRHVSDQSASGRFIHIEIPVHSFGFGRNTHESAEEAFARCVGGLLSVVVQDLKVHLGFASGSAPGEISAIYACNGRPTVIGSTPIRFGDVFAEEERELLLELRLPKPSVGSHHVLSVRCSYKDPSTQETICDLEQALLVPCPHAITSSDPEIERLRTLFITTRAMAESGRLVELGNLTSAYHLLSSARALLMQSGSVSAGEYIHRLEAELAALHWRRQQQEQQQMVMMQRQAEAQRTKERETTAFVDENGDPLTPTSAWRAAEMLAKVARMRKSLNRARDLHGFENARF
ncbi:von Willebrand factor, type A [Dillenia turbinata]|uniref:von Willebrand factor, type A n=1 Tax=Dillenia turbinata TaxID=194707 RepID=A0AAN8ZJW1_9MAGN